MRRKGFSVSSVGYFLYCDGDRFSEYDFLDTEIALECGTELLDLDLNEFSDAEKPATIEFQNRIEKTIKQILSTLHFDRTG